MGSEGGVGCSSILLAPLHYAPPPFNKPASLSLTVIKYVTYKYYN